MKKQKVENKALNIDASKLEDLFAAAIQDVALKSKDKLTLDEVECVVEKDFAKETVQILVTVNGMAGVATKRQIHDKKEKFIAKGFAKIDIDGMKFSLTDSYDLNTNNYVLVYTNE